MEIERHTAKELLRDLCSLNAALLLITAVVISPEAMSSDETTENEPGGWYIESSLGRTFYKTHGEVVHGHEFGFFKPDDSCSADVLWLTFSTYESGLDVFEGEEIRLKLSANDQSIKLSVPMLGIAELGSMEILLFSNWLAGPTLISFLEKHQGLTISIIGPQEIVEQLDITEDYFNLDGFADQRNDAYRRCMSPKSLG